MRADGSFGISILKRQDESGRCLREFFAYEGAEEGVGYFVSTYVGDGNPLPTFCGEPERVAIPDDIDELTEAGWYRQANKRAVNRAKEIIIKAHSKFYGAMTKYDNGKGIRQYNDAMDKFYAAINECVALTPPERAYNIVVAMCRLQMSQNDKLTFHTYTLSKEVAKIPKMLECLGIHDYGLDRIIEQRIRPIVFN